MNITPDSVVFWEHGLVKLNLTIATTWGVMLLLTVGAHLVTRRLTSGVRIPRWQNLLESLVVGMEKQVAEAGLREPRKYLGFVGTLFVFIAVSAVLGIVPGYTSPTGSLSTTAALALCVFVAVPVYGIAERGAGGYFKTYIQPSPFMLPFNVIGELSRTLALAVRLFGNVMSGAMIVAILLSVVPLLFPVVMNALGLLTGVIQAYIFAVLATVFIAAATRTREG